jgi:uncharacterized membrane protein
MRVGLADISDQNSSKDEQDFTSQRAIEGHSGKLEVLDTASELLKPLLRNPNQAPETAKQLVAVMETHRGPLPHPRILSGYESILPGSAQEILEMAKNEQSHRHSMERRETTYPYFGMGLGAVALFVCIGSAVFLTVYTHNERVALALISVPVIAAIGWLVNARLTRPIKEDSPKGPAKTPPKIKPLTPPKSTPVRQKRHGR